MNALDEFDVVQSSLDEVENVGGEGAREAAEALLPVPEIDRMVEVYIKLRDRRAARTSQYEKEDKEDREKMAVIENELLRRATAEGVTGFKTEHGVTYSDVKYVCSGADWGAFYDWIVENNAFDMLERRIKSTTVKTYMEENDGAVPPGVNVMTIRQMKVRRN